MRAIVVVEMTVETIAGNFKLNQHKSDADHVAVASALARPGDRAAQAIASRMIAFRPHLDYGASNTQHCRRRPLSSNRAGDGRELTMATKAKIGVLGASGYTGAELVRLLLRHPRVEIVLLTADRRAGQEMREVFPQFAPFELPKLVSIDDVDWKEAGLDLVFCALPHATTQKVIKDLLAKAPKTKVVDLSADFRLPTPRPTRSWYGHEHHAPELQTEAVYGLVEVYRDEIKKARLVANPGCYTTCAQLAARRRC